MKYTGLLLCLAATVLAVRAVSVSGEVGIDRNAVFAGGKLNFPPIPGFNAPLSNLFPPRPATPEQNSNGGGRSPPSPGSSPPRTGGSPFNIVSSLFDIPEPSKLIPDLSSFADSSFEIPKIPSLPDLSKLPAIPGLSKAIQSARNRVKTALQLGDDVSGGIQQAVQNALDSNDPTGALRAIIETIIDVYLRVALNCPLLIIASRVIQEGIRLALEIARAVANIILGTTTAPN